RHAARRHRAGRSRAHPQAQRRDRVPQHAESGQLPGLKTRLRRPGGYRLAPVAASTLTVATSAPNGERPANAMTNPYAPRAPISSSVKTESGKYQARASSVTGRRVIRSVNSSMTVVETRPKRNRMATANADSATANSGSQGMAPYPRLRVDTVSTHRTTLSLSFRTTTRSRSSSPNIASANINVSLAKYTISPTYDTGRSASST